MTLQNLEHLPEVDWNLIYNCHDINLAWRIFKNILATVFNKVASVITKRVREKCSSLLSAKIKSHMNISHMNIRNKLMQKVLKSKVNARRENYKRKHNEVNIKICKANSNYTRTLLAENSSNPDGFLAAIKRVCPSKAKNVKSEKSFVINEIKSTKPNEIANGFCNTFSTVILTLKQTSYPQIDFTWSPWEATESTITYHLQIVSFGYVSVIKVTQLLKKFCW